MLEVKEVVKSFEEHKVLENINCSFEEGKIYGIIGINGAGKSTLLRIINSIYNQDSGVVQINGENIWDNEELRQNIVFVSDDAYFFSGYTLKNMSDFYSAFYKRFNKQLLKELAGLLNLDMNKKIDNFSKGMKRQCSLIIALSTSAKYMFFDETFDGLDPMNRNIIKKYLKKIAKEQNKCIVLTSHNMRELEDICDTYGLLETGKLVFKDEIKKKELNYHKLQIAFKEPYNEELFININKVDLKKQRKSNHNNCKR